jgi:hypothetical protein
LVFARARELNETYMKALTLTQPWATLVAIGAKRIETRSWPTSYRGPLAIHAARSFPSWARAFTTEPICYDTVRRSRSTAARLAAAYPLGCVLATCRLANVLPTEVIDNALNVFGVSLEPLDFREKAFGDYSPGRYAWILEDVHELAEPIPAKGALGLWEWDRIPNASLLQGDARRNQAGDESLK